MSNYTETKSEYEKQARRANIEFGCVMAGIVLLFGGMLVFCVVSTVAEPSYVRIGGRAFNQVLIEGHSYLLAERYSIHCPECVKCKEAK